MATVEQRVDKLEEALMRLVYIQQKTEMEIQELKKEMKAFKDEMLEFKDEMRAFKDEMKDFKDEMLNFKDEMKAFKDEMRAFKDEMLDFKNEMKDFKDEMRDFKDEMLEFKNEMRDFKNETRREVRRINKQWGELANKMGTIVEDIVFPAVRPILKKYFGCEPDMLMRNIERRSGERTQEWDVIALCGDRLFMIEAKSTPRPEHIQQVKDKAQELRDFFPEYKDKDIVLIMASLSFKDDFIRRLTEEGIYAMAYREWEFMDLLNFEDLN